MLVSAEGHRGYRFGEFMLDLDRGALLKDGEEVALRPKSFEVLRYLVEHQGTLVTREALLAHAWPGVIVTDDSLTQCLIEIRRALGDEDKSLVRTVPRRGFIFEMPVEPTRRDAAAHKPRTDHLASNLAWLLGATTVLIGAAIGWWALSGGPRTQDGPATGPRNPAFDPPAQSIAVLAFDDLSPGGDQSWFAEGLSEEVLNLLAQVPELTVIARTSSFAFRDSNADIRTIAERLNVARVLEGSVRQDGDRVRVTAQLVDGVSETHLWSQTFDRTVEDVFGVQEDIAREVAEVLEVKLGAGGPVPVLDESRPSPEAWAEYLRAQHFFNRRGEGDLDRAEQHYRAALELDPKLGRAWAGLSGVYHIKLADGLLDRETALELQREAVQQALRVAPNDARVLNRAARYHYATGDRETARVLLQAAIEADPNDPLNLSLEAARMAREGDMERGTELQRRAAAVDPVNPVNRGNYAYFLLASGRFDEAVQEFRAATALKDAGRSGFDHDIARARLLGGDPRAALEIAETMPAGAERWQVEAMAWSRLENRDRADAATGRLEQGDDARSALMLAEVHADRGNFEQAVEWLETADARTALVNVHIGAPDALEFALFSPVLRAAADQPAIVDWMDRMSERRERMQEM